MKICPIVVTTGMGVMDRRQKLKPETLPKEGDIVDIGDSLLNTVFAEYPQTVEVKKVIVNRFAIEIRKIE